MHPDLWKRAIREAYHDEGQLLQKIEDREKQILLERFGPGYTDERRELFEQRGGIFIRTYDRLPVKTNDRQSRSSSISTLCERVVRHFISLDTKPLYIGTSVECISLSEFREWSHSSALNGEFKRIAGSLPQIHDFYRFSLERVGFNVGHITCLFGYKMRDG